jgi:hypothetical protein
VVSIAVEVVSSLISHIVLHVAFVEFSISKKNFYIAVTDFPVFESRFDHFIRATEKQTHSSRLVITPSSSVHTSVRELACTISISDSILEVALVDFSIAENNLTHSVTHALGDSTLVDSASDIFEIYVDLLEETNPIARHSHFHACRNDEVRVTWFFCKALSSVFCSVIAQGLLLGVLCMDHVSVLSLHAVRHHRAVN